MANTATFFGDVYIISSKKIIIPLNECHIFGSGTILSPESPQKLQTA